jgi:RHS repeat-associated protein
LPPGGRSKLIDQTIGSGSVVTFAYNAWSDMATSADTAGGQTTYTYDTASRLSAITPDVGNAAAFSLDALGRPATRVIDGATDTYHYLGSGQDVVQIDSAGTSTAAAIGSDGSRIRVHHGSTMTWLVGDLQGNLVASLDDAGSSYLTALLYDPYGRTLDSYDAGSAFPTPWTYAARLDVAPPEADTLYAMGARPYAPALGAFTQLDSYAGAVTHPASLNRFLYAEANPATLIDPDGHRAIETSGSGTMNLEEYHRLQVARATAILHANDVVAAKPRSSAAKDESFDVFGFVGTAGQVTLGVASRQVGNVLAIPGGIANLVVRTPGAIVAAPGAIADIARDPGHAWDSFSTGAIVGFRDWVVNTRADLLSGDPDRIANGINAAVDVAWVGTGVVGAGKALAGRAAGALGAGAEVEVAPGLANGAGRSLLEDLTASCSHSFSPETLVSTTTGLVAIASLSVGDLVLAYDPADGSTGPRTVTAVMVHTDVATESLTKW